jgi:DNA polymerase III subunit delta'
MTPARKTPLVEQPPERPPLETPKPFVGQERVVEYFRRVGPANLAHAYLFHGPRGVGKKTFAHALARTLHCQHPTSFPLGFDGTCGPCVRSLAGSSGDTLVVDADYIRAADATAGLAERKTDDMSIEAARSLVREMQMRSYEGGRMVCIIPDFENVTGDAVYNALLKELEEPDPGKLFLLTVEHPEYVLQTIRSRAIDIRFAALAEADIAKHLEQHYQVKKPRAAALARRAQGSLGDALDELDAEIASLRESARIWVLDCLRAPGSMPASPTLSKEDRESARADLSEIVRQAHIAVRDLAAYAVGAEKILLDDAHAPAYKRTCAALGDRALTVAMQALEDLSEAHRMSGSNVQPAQILGWLQIRLRSGAF